MSYITEEEYEEYTGAIAPTPFGMIEDLAVNELEIYCIAFPTLEEWETLGIDNPTVYSNIKKAIMIQMNYIELNRSLFNLEGEDIGFSLGRFKVDKPTTSDSGKSLLSDAGRHFMDLSGICNRGVCVIYKNKCNPCRDLC